jgi:hypothetical protein
MSTPLPSLNAAFLAIIADEEGSHPVATVAEQVKIVEQQVERIAGEVRMAYRTWQDLSRTQDRLCDELRELKRELTRRQQDAGQ